MLYPCSNLQDNLLTFFREGTLASLTSLTVL